MATEIRVKLLHLVMDTPEIKRDDIRAHQEFRDEEDRTLANLLYNTKKDGQLVADEGGRYTITARGRAYLKTAGVERRPVADNNPLGREAVTISIKGKKTQRYIKAKPGAVFDLAPDEEIEIIGKPGNAARAIAEQLAADAQTALDRYVESACNPAVLSRFRAARDQARDMVVSFDGATTSEEA